MEHASSPPHGPSRGRLAALLTLALAAPSCTLFDTRSQLQILPEGTLLAGASLTVTVQGPAGSEAQLYVDGEKLGGPVPVGMAVTLDTSAVAEGTRGLVARLAAAAEPRASTPSTVIVDHTAPAVVASPPEVVTDPLQPLVIELRFSEPVDPDSLALSLTSAYMPAVPAVREISADRTVVTFRVEPPLDLYGTVRLEGTAADRAGNAVGISQAWHLLDVDVVYAKPAPWSWVGGTVQVQADASPSVAQGVLYANGVEVASLGPSPWSVSWDATGVPEGLATLEIRVPGRYVRSAPLQVYIDNTAPTVVSCGNPRPVDPWVGECVAFVFSEDVTLTGSVLTVGVSTVPSYISGGSRRWFVCPYSLAPVLQPLEKVALVQQVRDRAGLGGSVSCAVPLRPVRHPWGDGPHLATGSFLGSPALAVSQPTSFNYYVDRASLFGSGPSGPSGAAPVVRVDGSAPGSWQSPESFAYDPTAAASDVRYAYPYYPTRSVLAWTERVAGGPGLLRFRWIESSTATVADFPPLNADASRDAKDPSLYLDNGYAIAAWSEQTGGGRAIRVKFLYLDQQTFVGGAVSDPLAVAERPSVWIHGPATGPAVAFLETAAGGVPQVRAAGWTGSAWRSLGGPANLDVLRPAADPVFTSWGDTDFFLAWVEAGLILVRRWDFYTLEWGPAEVLNTDAARPGRLLRGCQAPAPILAFVEATTGGDEIQARRWDGGQWRVLPGPASDGYVGVIADFTITQGGGSLAVAWTDAQGLVYLRVYNE